jgi:hypothetical protein
MLKNAIYYGINHKIEKEKIMNFLGVCNNTYKKFERGRQSMLKLLSVHWQHNGIAGII